MWQPEFSEMDPVRYAEHLAAARRRLEDDWCATLRAADVRHEAVLLEGDPRQAIPAWAAEHDVDLVVMGPHGRGRDHGTAPMSGASPPSLRTICTGRWCRCLRVCQSGYRSGSWSVSMGQHRVCRRSSGVSTTRRCWAPIVSPSCSGA